MKNETPIEHRLLLTATFCLLAGGAVMVFSASSARTVLEGGGDGTGYLLKYLMYGSGGLVAMHVLSRMGLDAVRRLTPIALAGSFVLLVLVLIPGLGVTINGAQRWLGAGPLQFQPSELMKLAIVLYIVRLLADDPGRAGSLRELRPLLLVVTAACALIVLQPDMGTSLVVAGATGVLLVAAGMPKRLLGALAGAGGVLVLVLAVIEPYRLARLTAFLDPWDDAAGSGFQAVQGQIALGSGGFFGLGLGESVQKIFYLPEAHTDFILAVIGEEVGVAGIIALLCLYGVIAFAGLMTAKKAQGLYAKLLAAGLTGLILCQALLNVFTVLGLAPLTGVPLPFISYGSTNLVVLLSAMGLLLNIAAGPRAAHLRAIPGRKGHADAASADSRGRDGRARGAGARRSGRAAG